MAAATIAAVDYSTHLGIGHFECAGATFTWVRHGPIDFLFIVGYLVPSLGLKGVNPQRLECWALWIKTYAGPWMIGADWNAEPSGLEMHPWLSSVRGHICTAQAHVTCTTGKGRHPVYIVVFRLSCARHQ